MNSNNQYLISELDICYESYFQVDENFVIPLLIHIDKIKNDKINNKKLKIEFGKNCTKLNKTENPFQDEIENYNFKNDILYYLNFIDDRKMFENFKYNFVELICGKNDLNLLYDKLMEKGLTKFTFLKFKSEIDYYISLIKNEFLEICKNIFDYERKFPPEVKTKHSIDKKYKDCMIYPVNMTFIQPYLEYNNCIFFKENLNKAIIDHSWREIQFKTMYISMKSKIESFTNEYHLWKNENR